MAAGENLSSLLLTGGGLGIDPSPQFFEYYGGVAGAIDGELINVGPAYHSYALCEPFDVVGVILPWNAPLHQAARAIAPALAAGNTVAAKPSEFTSGSLLALARLAVEQAGLPPGVLNVLVAAHPAVGAGAGGKSANIVFADADLAAAAPGAAKGFTWNSGQWCAAGTRLLVERSIHDALVDRLVEAVAQICIGPEPDAAAGPITTRSQ